MANITALQATRGQLIDQISSLSAAIQVNTQSLQQQLAALPFARTDGQRNQIENNISRLKQQIAQDTAELQRLTQQLAEIDVQIREAQLQSESRSSAGQVVANDQAANDEKADVIAPQTDPAQVAAPSLVTNADRFQDTTVTDEGTDADVRPITNTQALPPITARPGGLLGRIVSPNSPDQVIPTPSIVPVFDPFEVDGGINEDAVLNRPTFSPGQGGREDTGGAGTGVRAALNQLFSGQITPQSNVLDQYASYTYAISIYLMNANDYKSLIQNPNSLPRGAQLILQSGGAPVAGGALPTVDIQEAQQAADGNGAPLNVPELGRNPNFPLDYYLDDVRLTSYINGKGTNSAHNVFKVQFKVIEPNGITFLDNLYKATDQYVKLSGTPQVNYAAQNYLMVIRFYGYDKDGNLVLAQKQPFTDPISNRTVETVVEKYVPFQFTNIKFRVANKLVEYDCEAVGIPNAVASSPARGTIPYNVELTSQSLKDLLQGQQAFGGTGTGSTGSKLSYAQITEGQDQGRTERVRVNRFQFEDRPVDPLPGSSFDAEFGGSGGGEGIAAALGTTPTVTAGAGPTQNQAPPKASASGTKTLVTGLQDALNKLQEEWVAKGTIKYADRYFFELDPILAQAKVVPPGSTNLRNTPMAANDSARTMLPETQAVDADSRKFSILSGTSILQFLDQVVRNTSYIYEQQTKYYDPKTKELIPNGTPANVTGWYKISMQAVPQGANRYDTKRNDYAYDITYRVEVYAINDAKSDFFPSAQYRGTHKRYDYWFTGINTQILDYQQDFNYIYYIVQNARSPERTRTTTNHREVPRYFAQPRSDQSDQMNEGPVSEPSAQLADYLYSPGDTAKVKLRILGDPAWIQQGDVRGGLTRGNQLYSAFLPDGTVNYNGQEILFEVLWNKPVDYDLETGLMDPGTKNYNSNRRAGQAGDAVQTYVYRANSCVSIFNRGRFEQELEGSQIYFTLPQDKQQQAQKNERRVAAKDTAYRNPLVNIPAASPGLLDLDVVSGGEVNFAPTSLAEVLDSSKQSRSLFTPQSPRGASPAAAATSVTQIVGIPNETAAETNRVLGLARGPEVGPPSTFLTLRDGQTVQITSVQELGNYSGTATASARLAAANRLNLAQQAANSPTTAVRPQLIAKDN